jgi:hypothetical protein
MRTAPRMPPRFIPPRPKPIFLGLLTAMTFS